MSWRVEAPFQLPVSAVMDRATFGELVRGASERDAHETAELRTLLSRLLDRSARAYDRVRVVVELVAGPQDPEIAGARSEVET